MKYLLLALFTVSLALPAVASDKVFKQVGRQQNFLQRL